MSKSKPAKNEFEEEFERLQREFGDTAMRKVLIMGKDTYRVPELNRYHPAPISTEPMIAGEVPMPQLMDEIKKQTIFIETPESIAIEKRHREYVRGLMKKSNLTFGDVEYIIRNYQDYGATIEKACKAYARKIHKREAESKGKRG